MTVIRHLSIHNYRRIKSFDWHPQPGINCILGQGDVGKSSVLSAIEALFSTKRTLPFSDSDFHALDSSQAIRIEATIGDLPPELLAFDAYGHFLRGYDAATQTVTDEPSGVETVLTLRLDVESDLEAQWSLYSERGAKNGLEGRLRWKDRQALAALRIGSLADFHLSLRQGSVVSKLVKDDVELAASLSEAARSARTTFGELAKPELEAVLQEVANAATSLGIPIEGDPQAMLDPTAVSLTGGAVGLHDGKGTPLRLLGLGSLRLLIAALQQKVASARGVVLIDELEHGLEPHRIIRLLHALGSKDNPPTQQVFATTHSPVIIKELSAGQLHLLRNADGDATALPLGKVPDVQGPLRANPDAFVARAVVVCEGATEIGLMRGLDLYNVHSDRPSLLGKGIALADGQGDNTYRRCKAFQDLGFNVAVVHDSDKPLPPEAGPFAMNGGYVVSWPAGRSIEDEIFLELTQDAVAGLVETAISLQDEEAVNNQIQAASDNNLDLPSLRATATWDAATRSVLAKAARTSRWFKQIAPMETAAYEVIAPDLATAPGNDLDAKISALWAWMDG